MKKLIKISALLAVCCLVQTSIFAATPVREDQPNDPAKREVVVFRAIIQDDAVQVLLQKEAPGKSLVTIYDQDNNPIFKDALPKSATSYAKGYILSDLDFGNYTIAVTTGDEVVKTAVHVYLDEYDQKSFFFMN